MMPEAGAGFEKTHPVTPIYSNPYHLARLQQYTGDPGSPLSPRVAGFLPFHYMLTRINHFSIRLYRCSLYNPRPYFYGAGFLCWYVENAYW